MKKTVVAAIDNSANTGPVLAMARAMATLLDSELQAVHVRQNGTATVRALSLAANVPLQVLDGSPAERLVSVLHEAPVTLGVLGIRRHPAGGGPIGSIALEVVRRAERIVIAVPPRSGRPAGPLLRRMLVPLDGTARTARAVAPLLDELTQRGLQVVALHVFDAERVPRFSDQPQHEVAVWEREFLARYANQPGASLDTRLGWTAPAILEVAQTEHVDLIVLGWAQDMSAGRAQVVREVLARSSVPIVLVPLGGNDHERN